MPEPAAHPVSLEYILGLTAFTAGSVDIVSFTQLGGILASAMTGNLAFLGLYIGRGQIIPAIGSVIALAGYVLGTAAGNLATRGLPRRPSLSRLLGAEVILLAVPVALWLLAPHRPGSPASAGMILAFALAMGMQSIVGKKINLSNIPTVVFTSTLTNIVIGLTDRLAKGRSPQRSTDTKRQLASFFLYLFGALAIGLLLHFRAPELIALPLLSAGAALAVHLAAGVEPPAPKALG